MTIIVENGFAVRIPEIPSRYRCNCSKEWGCFVTGETKGLNHSKAEKAGLTKGSFVEMALCWVDKKVLTFEPNYINEPFTEIWGIPTGGEMKTQFAENASELSTFLIHRQSKDKLSGLIELFSRDAFNEWVSEGMKGDANEYAINKARVAFFTNIFRFEMTQLEGNYGTYFYVKSSYRKPQNELENKALIVSKQIHEGQLNGLGYCTDSRLEKNQEKCLLTLAENKEEVGQLNGKGNKNALTNAK
jgi:hypothetical protein